MSRVMLWIGWGIAVCAVIGCGFFFQQNAKQAARLERFDLEMAQLREEIRDLKQVKIEAAEELAALEEEADELRAVVAEAEGQALDQTDALALEAGAGEENPFAEIGEQIAGMLGGEQEEGEENPMAKAMEQLFSGEQGDQMVEMQANMITEMGYSDYFLDAQLPADVEESVRELLKEQNRKMMQLGLKALQGDLTEEDRNAMQEQYEAGEAELHDKIKDILTQEEYELFAAYDAEKEARMVAKSYEMQMGMMAPQVTPESRDIFVDAVMDELIDREYSQTDQFSSQMQGMPEGMFESIRNRIVDQVDEDQYGHIDRFIAQQEQIIEAITGSVTANE